MEEKDADEDGGEGGEVPQVQDGADQGHAPQLPVVAGDWESFHLYYKMFAPSQWRKFTSGLRGRAGV